MTVSLAQLNALSADVCAGHLASCCGSSRWVTTLTFDRPFRTIGDLLRVADEIWWKLDAADWLEAFGHHPRIGEKRSATPQSERASSWSASEQAGVATAAASVRREVEAVNAAYEARFGFIYIVCASGRSADDLLEMARARLRNEPEVELRVAAEEQRQITSLRLRKLITENE